MVELARGFIVWMAIVWTVSGVSCGGKVSDTHEFLLTPTHEETTTCTSIADWRTCVYRGCLWGGPDHCDDHSTPAGIVDHLSQGGCFAATICADDTECAASARCGYLAYAPCYFTPDGDGPQCTAYESEVCTYLHACVPSTP